MVSTHSCEFLCYSNGIFPLVWTELSDRSRIKKFSTTHPTQELILLHYRGKLIVNEKHN